jgi:signal transduction histidine kinase
VDPTNARPDDDPIVASILLVDDHRANLMVLQAVLAPLGQRLVSAASGAEALDRVAAEEFAVVLLDVMMPGLDGFGTAARMRQLERGRYAPIIFVTALDGRDVAARGYALGAADFLSKPFDADALLAKVGVFVDLHVQRERSKRQTALLRQREHLLGILGHDLRQPLAGIQLNAEALLAEALPDAAGRAARRIASSAGRMRRLLEDLLDFTRSRHGGLPVAARPCDLEVVCREVIDEALAAHPGRSVELAVEGDATGEWDPERLAQAAGNLVFNALAYSPRRARIAVRVRGRGQDAQVEVSNQGSVIPQELLPTLFDPFKRADAAGTGSGTRPAAVTAGLGLGLYIVRQIVEAHGGTVAVSSDAEGTTFTLVLPRTARHAPASVSGRSDPPR